MEPINLTKILKQHRSGWIAVSKDYKTLLATGKTLKEVSTNLKNSGKEGVLIPAAPNYQNFVT
jgi:hypothetical protein